MGTDRRSWHGEREADAASGCMAGPIAAGSGGENRPHFPPASLEADSVRSRWYRLAWLPIPLLAAAMVALWAADLPGYYESPFLLIAFNLVFLTLTSLFVAYLIARSFLVRGAPGLLLLGCGALTWGAAGGLVAVTASGWDINVLVTTHNLCVSLSALCHLAGAVLSLRTNRVLREAGLWLTAAYTVVLGCVGFVTLSALAGWTPAFFVQGQGGTPLRSLLLGSATAMFVATALVLATAARKPLSAFLHWYTLALGLIAVGLFGIMIESVHGGPLSWTGRTAQFLGGAYLLISAIASVRESRVWGISLEETLQRERTFVSAVLETVGALVTVLDRQGRIVTFNRVCEEATGYRLAEVKGRCFWEFLLTADEIGPVQAAFARLKAGEFPIEHENYWVAKDGTRRLIHWTNTCLADASGAVEYVIGTGIDVTERRRAEAAVRESEDRLRRIARAGHIGFFEWNASRNTAYWSPENYEIFGLDPGLPVNWDRWLAIVHPDDRERLTRNAAELRAQARGGEQGGLHKDEYRIVREDGAVHWLESEVAATLVGDDIVIRGSVRDVSARKQAEMETDRMRVILSEAQRIAHVGGWEYIAATQETVWSKEERRIYGLDPAGSSPLYQDMLRHHIHPDDAARLDETFRQCLREHAVFELEHRIVRPDGSVRVVYELAHPYLDDQGELVKYIGATLDITERRKADAELRESEERLRAVLDNSPDAIFLKDRESRLLLANPATFAIIGKPPEACLGRTDAEFYDDEATGRAIIENDRRIIESGRMETVEETVSEPQGRRVYLSTKAPYRDAEGRIIGLVGLARDITEHKRAEEALRESEVRLRTQVERMPIGCIVHDDRNCFTHVNPAAERILGYSEAELRGQHVSVIVPEAARAHVDAILQRIAEGDMTAHSLNENVTKDGRIITCQWTNTPLRDAKGAFIGFLSMVQDITEQKRAERALRQSREDLDRAQEVGQIGWWRLDTRQDILTWSDENYRIFGVPKGAPLSYETFLEIVHPEDRQYADAKWRAGLRGEPYDIEHRIVADGRVKWVREKAYLEFGSDGELLGGFGITQDITTRKQIEESLVAAKAAAEAATVAKSQFLANMSHELRTPMNAILGMIDVALPRAIEPTVRDCLQTARGSADLLLTLLNDLLDSAKIESGKLELESAPFSLRRMLDQTTRVLSVRASEKGLCFYCRMPNETPDAVIGDRMRLQQVLLNLAGNAIKFTERGEVEVNLHARLQDSEACLEFAVRDTGIGISPSGLERLFRPFGQADTSMSRRFGGTGLGLSISKSLVEMMGGSIRVESELGVGSTFFFTVRLPLAKGLSPDFEAPALLPAAACGPLRVLLVEDNPANQKVAMYLLQDRGHLVEVAGDGREALGLTEHRRYDVILMDVQMPGMDGLEATAAIRRREGGGTRVPIIAMTAHAMRGDRERCLAAGMDGYLSKPVNAREMIGLIETLARGRAPVAAVAAGPQGETLPQATAFVFDPDEALTRCSNNRHLVREIIQCFYDEVDNLFPQMRVALKNGDLAEIGHLGHRMKGTVVYLGAQPAKEAALRVEQFCEPSGGTLSEAEDAINVLERECLALKSALARHPLAAAPTRDGLH